MKSILHYLLTTTLLLSFSLSYGQARDGDMRIDIRMEDYYFESGDDIWPDKDEFVWEARLQDQPDLDGAGWWFTGRRTFDNGIFTTGPYFLGIPGGINRSFIYGATRTLGPRATPLGFRWGFEGWEDDCFDCSGGTICLGTPCGPPSGRTTFQSSCPCSCECLFTGGDDQYCNNEMTAPNFLGFRFAVPYQYNYFGLTRTGNPGYSGGCSGNNPGVTYSVQWSSPCADTFWADRPIICDPGYVTLNSGGAKFGGTYRWYRMSGATETFIQETADSFFTVYVPSTTVFRVYTKNNGQESWSYRQITILIDRPLITAINIVDPACNDSASGSIQIRANSLLRPLEYSINNGLSWSGDSNFNALRDGIYLVKVRNPACEVPPYGLPIRLVDPPQLNVAVEVVDSVRCNGENNGAIYISVGGGTPGYTYTWSNGSTREDVTGLVAGSYYVTVRDSKGCQDSAAAVVYQPPVLTATISSVDVTCPGASDGTSTVVPSGGRPPYRYLWSNGTTLATATGLGGGLVTCVITDANNCQVVLRDTIIEGAPLNLTFVTTPVSCYGGSTGRIFIDTLILGGIKPYTYTWSPAGPNSPLRTGLVAGTYNVTVRDNNGCTVSGSTVVNQPDSLRVNAVITNPACNGDTTGAIDITVLGGTFPYTYSWTGGTVSTSEDLTRLRGGTYNLLVRDANMCTYNTSFVINEPALLTSTITTVDNVCHGGSTGMAKVNVTGGSGPFTYLWSTFATIDSITGLSAGNYTVLVLDRNGCSHTNVATIYEGPPINILNPSITNVLCFGDSTGSISCNISGGTGSLSVVWSTGLVGVGSFGTYTHNSLPAGTYYVTVTDSLGCSKSRTFVITEPSKLNADITGNNPLCYDNSTGFAIVTAWGGVLPYRYTWSTTPPQTGVMAIGLGPGSYVVSVRDFNNCLALDTVQIIAPDTIKVTPIPADVKCFGGSDGRVAISVRGGARPYKYTLNGILQSDSTFRGLTAANYIVQVEDANGCVGQATFRIDAPTNFKVSLAANPDLMIRGQVTTLTATPTLPVIGYRWYPSDSIDFSGCPIPSNCNPVKAKPNQDATYIVEAISTDTCSTFDTITVIVKQTPLIFIPTAFTPNSNNLNETFDFKILGVKTAKVTIFNRWGEMVYFNPNQEDGQGKGWNGTIKGQPAQSDTYIYQIEAEYLNGNSEVLKGSVNLLR